MSLVEQSSWWTIGSTAAGIGALIVAILQLRVSLAPRPKGKDVGRSVPGAAVSAPTGLLPAEVVGRSAVVKALLRRAGRPGRFIVLVGMGGVGKSTVAIEVARRLTATRPLWRRPVVVWWLNAANPKSLSLGAVSVVKQAGGGEADVEAVATGTPDAPDVFWRLLSQTKFRWLLIFDNADDPRRLQPEFGTGTIVGGNGWVRASRRGLALVTSRHSDASTWGSDAEIMMIEPLEIDVAAAVLIRLAPRAGDLPAARVLAEHFGGLPLALQVAGRYLSYPLARWKTFSQYLAALQDHRTVEAVLDHETDDARGMIMQTWELSLDALAEEGLPQARPVLRLLSCYAAAMPVPMELLDPQLLGPLFPGVREVDDQLNRVIRGLVRLGLLNAADSALLVHPVIVDASRAHMSRPGTQEPDPDVIRSAAVDLAATRCARLDFSLPADWPWFSQLTPHLHALLSLPLGPEPLGRLCRAAAKTSLSYDWSGGLRTAIDLTDAALAAAGPLGEEHESVLRLRQQQVLQRGRSGFWLEAEGRFGRLLENQRRVLGEDHPVTLSTLHDLGRSYAHQGRWTEAEGLARDVCDRRGARFGWDHPATLASRHHLGRALAAQQRWEEADRTFAELLADERRVLGDEHPTTLATRAAEARTLASQGRWPAAEDGYRALAQIRRRVLGEDHPATMTSFAELAHAIEQQGRLGEAVEIHREVLTARQRVLGDEHPDTVLARQTLTRLS